MNLPKIHKSFKLNGRSFKGINELLNYTKVLDTDIYHFLKVWFNKNSFVEVTTSGSTGNPKKIKLLKKAMQNSALATAHFFSIHSETKALLCMSAKFIAGKMMLVRALELGWHLDVVKPTSKPLAGINTYYTFSAMIPLQVQASIQQLNQIKKLIIGGGAISGDLVKELQNIECECFATYGMTETATHIALKKLNNFSSEENYLLANYKALPNIEVNIDERNCLVINAPNLISEKIVTNDVVELISPSEFRWIGRFDNVVNSGGVKLFPEEIEKQIAPYIKHRFFVAGIPHKVLGEALVLVIESKQVKYNSILAQLKNTKLTKYQIPKNVFFIDEFVETGNAKIQRKKTLERIKNIC